MYFEWRTYWQVIKSLKRNKLRSFLTSLGIIIGISSVIIIMSVGAGAQSLVINQIRGVGSDLLGIMPGKSEDNGPPAAVLGIVVTSLIYDDAKAIAKQVPGVEEVAAYARGAGTVTWQNQTVDTSFVGVTPNYLRVESTNVDKGSFFTDEDENESRRVVVLGYTVAQDIFNGANAIGERIKINKETFNVIGVMPKRGTVAFQSQDDQIFIPLSTAQNIMLGIQHVSLIRAKVRSGYDLTVAKEDTAQVLRDQHNILDPIDDDFTVRASQDAIDLLTSITSALNYFLAMVAAISLIVGGVGIMNIMLVSVTESTREIGLRKAVGARRKHISVHFLTQTIALTMVGGIIGIVFGILISFLIAVVAQYLGYKWDFIVPIYSVFMALIFTFIVGLSFGWYPARKAANLDPIVALRYE